MAAHPFLRPRLTLRRGVPYNGVEYLRALRRRLSALRDGDQGGMLMKIGICTNPASVEAAARAGFDYVEFALTQVAAWDETDFAMACDILARTGMASLAMNVMLPGELKVFGPQASHTAIVEYLDRAWSRARQLGIRTQVFGSGAARTRPQGLSLEEAHDGMCALLRLISPVAHKHGVRLAIEPLRPQECNYINTVADALKVAHAVNLGNIGVLADWYHMRQQDESCDATAQAGPLLYHCHISTGDTRVIPLPLDGEVYAPFLEALRVAGYDGLLSAEGRGEIPQYPGCVTRMRQMALEHA